MKTFLSRFRNPDGSWNGGVNDFSDTADFRQNWKDNLKQVDRNPRPQPDHQPAGARPHEPPSAPVVLPYPASAPCSKAATPSSPPARQPPPRRRRRGITAWAAWARPEPRWNTPGRIATTIPRCRSACRRDAGQAASGLAALAGPAAPAGRGAARGRRRFEAVLGWLNANPGWLLILDNIDDAPALKAAAHGLLGRLRGRPRAADQPADAVPARDRTAGPGRAEPGRRRLPSCWRQRSGRRHAPDDAARARALAEALVGSALALEMAAATIEAAPAQLRGVSGDVAGQPRRASSAGPGAEITGYHHAVAETWQTSVDQLTPAGRELLERLAFLAPEPVPELLLDVPVPEWRAGRSACGAGRSGGLFAGEPRSRSGTFRCTASCRT